MKRALMLTLLENADGEGLKDIRKMARKQLVLEGIKEPETEEEAMMLQQAQGEQKQDPAMVLAMAEQIKANAALLSQQRQAQKDASDAAIANTKVQVDAFNAETGRMSTQIEAEKANADIQYKQFNAFNTRVQTAAKIQGDLVSRLRGSLTQAQR